MNTTSQHQQLFVDDIVTSLTGAIDAHEDFRAVFQDRMRRASTEFDLSTAEAFAHALLDALCLEPLDLRRLEALLVLGLAHPSVLVKHCISLEVEAQRLAVMLDHAGDPERGQAILAVVEELKSGPVVDESEATPITFLEDQDAEPAGRELAQRYLDEASELVAQGRLDHAIRVLQEVVALDRNRRDVARMIRDLRFQKQERKVKLARLVKAVAVVLVLAGVVAGFVWRERAIAQQYASLPAASSENRASLAARLEEVDALVTERRAWLGLADALSEHNRLQREIDRLDQAAAALAHEAALVEAERAETREAARTRGLSWAMKLDYQRALVDLRAALELSSPNWEHRNSVIANIQALEAEIQAGKPAPKGTKP